MTDGEGDIYESNLHVHVHIPINDCLIYEPIDVPPCPIRRSELSSLKVKGYSEDRLMKLHVFHSNVP